MFLFLLINLSKNNFDPLFMIDKS